MVRAACWAVLALSAGTVNAAPVPLMKVLIKPGPMSQTTGTGDIDVRLTIPEVHVPAGAVLLRLGTIVPGMAKPQPVSELAVTDARGAASLVLQTKEGNCEWSSTRALEGNLEVRYHLPVENIPLLRGGPPVQLRIDGDGFSGVGNMLIALPLIQNPYRIAIQWDLTAMGPGAAGVSSYGDGDVVLPAGLISRLGSTLFMAGHIKRSPEKPAGAFSAVWLGEPPFDPRPAMQWTAQLHQWMSGFFKDKTEPPYRVFLRYNPMNAGGGAALTHSFLVTYGAGVTGENLKSILGHEMTHTWTSNDGLGQWYNEGNAVYYQALLAWRAGLITADQFLADLNQTASRYYTNALRATPEDQVLPHFWEDTRIRVLPYDRGAMYFAVLNGKIRKKSAGRRSIDDLIQTMIVRARAGERLSDTVWVDLLAQELGEDGVAVHKAMLAGGLMLPESDGFGPCFRRTVKKIRQFDLGFDNASLLGAVKTIKGLKPGFEAAKAGLRDGDDISYGVALDAVQAEVNRTLTLQVTRDGKTFPLTYLPRGEAVDAYQWERIAQESRPSNEPADFLRTPPKPASVRHHFKLIALGDLLYSHPFANRDDPALQKVFELIRSGDATIANREGVFFDLRSFKGAGYGDGLLWGEAALGKDMQAMGINMVSMANNHSTDWGGEGLLESQRLLDAVGIVHAGAGRTLEEARRAAFLQTPKGRVALVSTASSFKANAGADDAFDETPARTGISLLRTRTIHLVTAEQLSKIRMLATQLASPLQPAPAPDAREVIFQDQIYRLSDKPGLHYEMELYDHAGLLKSVRDAKQAADLVVFTIHAHESPTGDDDDTPAPPDFLVRLFHDAVDAGADVILGGGPHSLRGVEIYKGRPVLYGMGAFFINADIKALQETALQVYPDATGHAPPPKPPERSVRPGGNPASWYDGVVAITDFEDGTARTVRLYPLDLGNTYDRSRRGIPHLADPANAMRILTALQSDSRQFGTEIKVEGSVGVIRIP
jgi:poly-gamma-glutamate capsule biosynthesis protein CapA/YwtB (metallophosphatase superfamily)/predicted metalloprotease with PDZ domain